MTGSSSGLVWRYSAWLMLHQAPIRLNWRYTCANSQMVQHLLHLVSPKFVDTHLESRPNQFTKHVSTWQLRPVISSSHQVIFR